MSKNNISDELIITTSARLSNEVGLNNLSLKMIAEELNIKSPSLYNHISSLDEIKEKLMIYGWNFINFLNLILVIQLHLRIHFYNTFHSSNIDNP